MWNVLVKLLLEIISWIEFIVLSLPGNLGVFCREKIFRKKFSKCGNKIRLNIGIRFTGCNSIEFGDECGIDRFSYVLAHNNGKISFGNRVNLAPNVTISAADGGLITIGSDVIIAPNTVIRASNHNYLDKTQDIRSQGHCPGEVVIGNDVWIGSNVVILPNVKIGTGAVIGAGSIVSKSIGDYCVAVGAPARTIRKREENE